MSSARPASLLTTARHVVRELEADEVPRLQALFDANPEYFQVVNGRPALANEAQLEFEEFPPPSMSFSRRWFCGVFASDGELDGVLVFVSDLMAEQVWHLTLFLVATRLYGSGAASELHVALERWFRDAGARWIRLGVVRGNARGERFWQRHGYIEVRVREGIDTGGRINDLRVMVKALAGQPLADYLERVPRDRPDPPPVAPDSVG
jgi:GNAT superfamily N-acetyltransferase